MFAVAHETPLTDGTSPRSVYRKASWGRQYENFASFAAITNNLHMFSENNLLPYQNTCFPDVLITRATFIWESLTATTEMDPEPIRYREPLGDWFAFD